MLLLLEEQTFSVPLRADPVFITRAGAAPRCGGPQGDMGGAAQSLAMAQSCHAFAMFLAFLAFFAVKLRCALCDVICAYLRDLRFLRAMMRCHLCDLRAAMVRWLGEDLRVLASSCLRRCDGVMPSSI